MGCIIGSVFFLAILRVVAGNPGSPSSPTLVHPKQRKDGQGQENGSNNSVPDYAEVIDDSSMLPFFPEKVDNVTVKIGQNAELKCKVENLNNYKVAWVRVDTQTILTIHNNVITRNPRISLSRPSNNQWFLHIQRVQPSDRGWYMCQVNTDPMVQRSGYFEVVVPPKIISTEVSPDPVVREGDNLTLSCDARGHPKPHIVWRREDSEDIMVDGRKVSIVEHSELRLPKISRLHMGDYLCVASNGIPPSTSKKYRIRVQFPPMFWIPSQLEGAYIGKDVTLECHSEAFPKSINYWVKEDGAMLISNSKYETLIVDSSYKVYMKLRIRNVTKEDFMQYKCVAKNSLGGSDGTITLYEVAPPTTTTPPTVATEATIPTTSISLAPQHTKRPRKNGQKRTRKRQRQKDSEDRENRQEDSDQVEEEGGGVGSSEEVEEERIIGDVNSHISFTIETKDKNMVLEQFGEAPPRKSGHTIINSASQPTTQMALSNIMLVILTIQLLYNICFK